MSKPGEEKNDQNQESQKNREYKYFCKHKIKLDSQALIKQQVAKRRDILKWHVSIKDSNLGPSSRCQTRLMRTTKRIQKLVLEHSKNAEKANRELSNMRNILKNLRPLKSLYLFMPRNDGVCDKGMGQVAGSLRKLAGLKHLNICIYSKMISEDGLQELCKSLKRISSLENLLLKSPQTDEVTDEVLQKLSRSVKRLKNLQKIHFYSPSNKITKQGIQVLGEELKGLCFLKDIRFDLKWFAIDGLQKLAQSLKELHPLKNIMIGFLQEREYRGDGMARELSERLKGLSSVQNLGLDSLNFSCITDEGMEILSQTLKELVLLKSLSMKISNSNELGEEGIRKFAESLKGLICLKSLELKFNICPQFGDNEMLILSQGVKELRSLQHLSLGFFNCGQFTNEKMEILGQNLKELKSLETLKLEGSVSSEGTNKGFESLREGFENLENLQKITLDFSGFLHVNNEGLRLLTQGLERLGSLKKISLAFRKFFSISNAGLKILGENLKRSSSLRQLKLVFSTCNQVTEEGILALGEDLKGIAWWISNGSSVLHRQVYSNIKNSE